MLNAGPLGFLGGFGLRLGGRGHERDQRVPDGHLHRIIRRAGELRFAILATVACGGLSEHLVWMQALDQLLPQN
jgi:hypothetical protein